MDVDVIDLTLTTSAGTLANNDVISSAIEIPNAVSVNGGSGIIQSIMLFNEDDSVESPALEILIAQDNTAIGSVDAAVSMQEGVMVTNLLGAFTVSNWSVGIPSDNQWACKSNIGIAVKADDDTTSLYMHVINRSGGNYTPSSNTALKCRIGIVKD